MTDCGQAYSDEGWPCTCNKPSGNHRYCSGWSDRVGRYVDWPNPDWVQPKHSEDGKGAKALVRQLAAKARGNEGAEGSERAAQSWTPEQRLLVASAITEVADKNDEFTTDHVWAALGDQVPKTHGMAALLQQAAKDGYITPTDRYADSQRARNDHDQGRRLRVWRSLLS